MRHSSPIAPTTPMDPHLASHLISCLMVVVRRAGDAILHVYANDDSAMRLKADRSPVTAADLAAHRCLIADLAELIPDCPVVSEEDESSLTLRHADSQFWLIDPLDGTKEFIARNGEFTVNIALIAGGRSVLGVVYAPALDQLYCGGHGLGAFRLCGKASTAIRVKPSANKMCRVVASKSHLDAMTIAYIERLGETSLVQAGSSLKFCRIAEGAADIYPRMAPTCEWDTAAAQAVLEGAGGMVVDLMGKPLRYGKQDILNPPFIATRDAGLIPA